MDGYEGGTGDTLNLSRLNLESLDLDEMSQDRKRETQQLYLPYNRFTVLPASISLFSNLVFLDISHNGLAFICEDILRLSKLKTLIAKNNRLDEFSLPKDFGSMSLEVINFSGNRFEEVPSQFLKLQTLHYLSLGGNRLKTIPSEIENLTSLEMLYLGGNAISSIPPELANLRYLSYLVLCDNRIQSIPPQLTQLHSLRSLSLHNNLLTYLPREILSLIHLQELSLRGNPLVVRFVKDMTYDPPSLLELAGRTIKSRNLPYTPWDLPGNLVRYLDLASKCPNPKCGGVYFDSCVRHIKFVDFCGKYRLPLMHYLCSPECTSPCSSNPQSDADSEDESSVPAHRMQKVLLG
ncbi:leucine-rich repeat-containing protein 58 [Amia ocellicauda]|uniref:leucine-rich repeat-containing protein 58 n=1 Tax=Amia ocellicauda TaxID=2972642 RepID=UPI00346413DE